MNSISAWLLSIAGIVILSVLAELVLPEGQMNKYTKVIFSFIILLVIIMPFPKLFGKDFDISEFFNSETSLQEDYLYQLNLDKLNALNEDISINIKEEGLNNVSVSINANILTENLEIIDVFVDLCDLEYAQDFENKNITSAKAKIKKIIYSYALLENVEVKFNE